MRPPHPHDHRDIERKLVTPELTDEVTIFDASKGGRPRRATIAEIIDLAGGNPFASEDWGFEEDVVGEMEDWGFEE